MEKIKKIGKKIVFPHILLAIPIVCVGFGMVVYSLASGESDTIFAYVSYFLSAYALVVVSARGPCIYRWTKRTTGKNKYFRIYTSEADIRVKWSLYWSVTLNGLYALMQLVLGFYNHSVWFYALGGYYVLLILMRVFLLKEMKSERWGESRENELQKYLFCGLFLIVMNIALAVVVFYIVRQNRGFSYHYIATIGMAAYTFMTFTLAIINMVKYRKYNSPVMSATKVINMVAAMVSMLSLETAMITAFGDEGSTMFRQIVTAASGTVVCVSVLTMAIYMIVVSSKEINKSKKGYKDGK